VLRIIPKDYYFLKKTDFRKFNDKEKIEFLYTILNSRVQEIQNSLKEIKFIQNNFSETENPKIKILLFSIG
jgi:hypothetical protein